MKLFRKNKKENILDLSEKLRKQQEKINDIKQDLKETSTNSSDFVPFPFFDNNSSSTASTTENPYGSYNNEEDPLEKKKKLTKRLIDMTTKIEDLSNQIYHLQQRLEVVERKLDVNRF